MHIFLCVLCLCWENTEDTVQPWVFHCIFCTERRPSLGPRWNVLKKQECEEMRFRASWLFMLQKPTLFTGRLLFIYIFIYSCTTGFQSTDILMAARRRRAEGAAFKVWEVTPWKAFLSASTRPFPPDWTSLSLKCSLFCWKIDPPSSPFPLITGHSTIFFL